MTTAATAAPGSSAARARGMTAAAQGSSLGGRKARNLAVWGLCGLALVVLVAPLVWVVAGIVARAVPDWQWSALTHTHAEASAPGLWNAVVGTLTLTAGIVVLAGAFGVAGGVYLAEYCPAERGGLLRLGSEVLSGVPSIVLGYVGYVALVSYLHWGFGLLPAWIVLAVLVLPYVIRSTEVAVRNVPTAYREGAEALGAGPGWTLRTVVIRPALPGVVTGLILAAAISIGETAPLLYTAHWADRTNDALLHSPYGGVGYLTYAVYEFLNEPSAHDHVLASDAALILVVLVLALMVVARVLVALTQKYSPDRQEQRRRRRG